MNSFYANPGQPWIDEEYQGELETAEIITVEEILTPVLILGRHGPEVRAVPRLTFGHGPNGCSNEKALMQLIIDEIIPKNNNIVTSLMNLQINGSFPKK